MSSAEESDDLVERTKRQIRGLVSEIARLSKSEVTPQDFYNQFLDRVVQALQARGGAVWIKGNDGGVELTYQVNLRETRIAESEENMQPHGRLLQQVFTQGEGLIVQPHSGSGGDDKAANPSDFLLLMGPLRNGEAVQGVIEVFQRPGARPDTQAGYLRFLMQMCELGGEFLKSRQLRSYSDRQALWTQLETFTRTCHASLDPRETAYTIANEGRRLIDCDRVSVAIRRGRRCQIEAISGQDTFDKRSNTVSMLAELATAVTASGDAVWYTGDTRDMAPQVEEAVQAYVDESHSKTVAVIPLRPPMPPQEPDKPEIEPAPIAALIVEQIEDSRPREGMLQRVDVVAGHSAMALSNALQHQGLFLMPVWRAIGRSRALVSARNLPKTIAAAVAIVAALLALVFVPADFELKGEGTLEPIVERDIFADVTGEIDEVLATHRMKVQKDDLLARMRSSGLNIEITKLLGERATALEEMASASSIISNPSTPAQERNQQRLKHREVQTKLNGIEDVLALRQDELKRLEVRSTLDGIVVTDWETLESLEGRPIERGQVLMTVAYPDGEWELEVEMPEDRMGHIAAALKNDKLEQPLKVTYILATEPGKKHEGWVKEVHARAEVRGDKGNTVLIRVKIDKSKLDPHHVHPGAAVSARVYCGRRSIGYVWFHDLVGWVQRTWFQLW